MLAQAPYVLTRMLMNITTSSAKGAAMFAMFMWLGHKPCTLKDSMDSPSSQPQFCSTVHARVAPELRKGFLSVASHDQEVQQVTTHNP
jgi:hypothetical protein